MRKIALEALQNRNGGKNNPRVNANGVKSEVVAVVSPLSIANMSYKHQSKQ
jgi:hypothetical protein